MPCTDYYQFFTCACYLDIHNMVPPHTYAWTSVALFLLLVVIPTFFFYLPYVLSSSANTGSVQNPALPSHTLTCPSSWDFFWFPL